MIQNLFLFLFFTLISCNYYGPGIEKFVVGKNYSCNHFAEHRFVCHADGTNFVFDAPEEYEEIGSPSWWLHILFGVVLIAFSSLMAILMRSYLTQDIMALKVQINGGSVEEQKFASNVYPVVQKHYLLLATLLIAPCIANQWLPIFLTKLFPDWLAILVSVAFIFMFDSILPQGLGKKTRLSFGYHFSWLAYLLIVVLYVVAWPLSKIFEYLIGKEEQTYFGRSELKEIFSQHGKIDGDDETGNKNSAPLSDVEIRIIRGALSLREKKCNSDEIYTPLEKVFMLPLTATINQETREKIIKEGHSRIPVYLKQPHNMIGLALTKTLLALDPEQNTPLANVDLVQVGKVTSDTPLYTLLNQFTNAKKGKNPNQTMKNKSIYLKGKGEKKYNRSHMAIVLDAKDNLTVLGVVTLEDVIEELLEAEVWDEKDIPNIPNRPELQGVLLTSTPKTSVSVSKGKLGDEKNPLFTENRALPTTTPTSTSGTSTPYKYNYGSTDQ